MAEETVFICYRRDDSGETAGRIFDRLSREFPAGTVFRDLDSIPLGVDFREHVRQKLTVARVVLVLIGPDWLTITDMQDRRRLDDAADHVRVEIELALGTKNVRVIPILCRHAEMPGAYDLPESIRDLAFKNGQAVRPDPDFHRDVDHLREQITRIIAEPSKRPERKTKAVPKSDAVVTAPLPAPAPEPTPVPAPLPSPAKAETEWKEIVQNVLFAVFALVFWGAILYGAVTGGRYAIAKVTDYFRKPTPAPGLPFPYKPVTPWPTGAGMTDWKDLKPGGSQAELMVRPAPTPVPTLPSASPLGGKLTPGLDRKNPATIPFADPFAPPSSKNPTSPLAPALGGKPSTGLGRMNPATDPFAPILSKTPTPTPTPSFNERIKKIFENQPTPVPAPAKR